MPSLATCLLLRQPRTRRWWARRELRVEDGRTSSCLATPSKNTDLMLSLVYLKTPRSPFSRGMNEAQNVLSSHTRPSTILSQFTLSLILRFSFLSSPAIQSCLTASSHVWMPLLVWSFFLPHPHLPSSTSVFKGLLIWEASWGQELSCLPFHLPC